MPINASITNFNDVSIGDELIVMTKTESQETIDMYAKVNNRATPTETDEVRKNLHTDPEYAKTGIFAGTVNMGVATCGHMMEALELSFPYQNLVYSKFSMRALEPFRPGDQVKYSGKINNKYVNEETGKIELEVELTGTNQLGQLIASAQIVVPEV